MKEEKISDPAALNRREAVGMLAGTVFAGGATIAGLASPLMAAGQAAAPPPAQAGVAAMVQAMPPATDPRFPMPPVWKMELRQLAPHVYAFVQGGGPGQNNVSVSNAGMIEGPEYLVAIDTTEGPIPAKTFIAKSKQTTGKDFARVVNTHHHADHVDGNQFFPGAEIYGHPYCRAECVKQAAAQAAGASPTVFAKRPGVAEGTEPRKLVIPTTTFEDNYVQYLGNTRVEYLFAGPSHTWGDVIAYIPEHKIIFAGDIAFFWVAPFAQNGWVSKWIEQCDKILGMDVDIIVPGHGPIGGKRELNEMADYFRVLTVEARRRYLAKMSAGAAAADIRLGRFDNWIGPERIVMDTVRLYDEWNSSLTPDIDIGGIREATIEYNAIKQKSGAALLRPDFPIHAC